MALKRTVEPTTELMTLAEAKLHLKQNELEDDGYISSLITAVRQSIENSLHISLNTQTWVYTLDYFPTWTRALDIPRPPLQAISSVTYVDYNAIVQTWDASKYLVDTISVPGRIMPVWGLYYPIARPQLNSVTITFTCGQTVIPKTITRLAYELLGLWYETREAAVERDLKTVPFGAESLMYLNSWGSDILF